LNNCPWLCTMMPLLKNMRTQKPIRFFKRSWSIKLSPCVNFTNILFLHSQFLKAQKYSQAVILFLHFWDLYTLNLLVKCRLIDSMCQFHSHFAAFWYESLLHSNSLLRVCTFIFIFGERKKAKKMLVKCWQNWLLVWTIDSSSHPFYCTFKHLKWLSLTTV